MLSKLYNRYIEQIKIYAKSYLDLCQKNPGEAISLFKAFVLGSLHVLYFCIFNQRVKIKFPFFMFDKFCVSGPGKVFIDKSCSIFPNIFTGVSIVTLTPQAIVKIGKNASLGGLTIRCMEGVEIGDKTMTGNSLIQDSLFSECTDPKYHSDIKRWIAPQKVNIGKNVWIGSQCCVLCGTSINDNSVLSLGAVCHNVQVSKYHLVSGNPSFRTVPITKLIKLFK